MPPQPPFTIIMLFEMTSWHAEDKQNDQPFAVIARNELINKTYQYVSHNVSVYFDVECPDNYI